MRPTESFVQQPVRSLQTMLYVLSLDNPKYPTIIPDGIYGPDTMHAVTAFQRLNRIPVNGVVDQTTWDAIVLQYEPALVRVDKAESIEILLDPGETLNPGQNSPYVYLAQSMLTQLSNDYLSIPSPGHSGCMDALTVEAIEEFQILAGLPRTGVLDKMTWKHLSRQFTLNAHHNHLINRECI